MAERIAKAQNSFFTNGTGIQQPQGIVTAAAVGHTAADDLDITWGDLVRLESSVSSVYRRSGSVGYMFNDAVLGRLKLMSDTTGRPLWTPGVAASEPDRINGHPYFLNPDMAAPAAGAKTVLFGDFSQFVVRDVRNVQLVRLTERYIDCFQVGYLAFQRADSRLLNPEAIKALVQAAA